MILNENFNSLNNLFIDKSPEMIWIIGTDSLTVKYSSSSVYKFIGFHENEIVNHSISVFFNDESIEKVKYIIKSIQTSQIDCNESTLCELPFKSKNNEIIHTETSFCVFNKNGENITEIIAISRNIKEKKKALEVLKESEEKYRALVERANDGIVIIQDGKLQFVNSMMAKILGYDISEITDTDFSEYIVSNEYNKIEEMYKQCSSGKITNHIFDSILVGKSKVFIDVEFNFGIVTFNRKPAILVYIRDITDRKHVTEALANQLSILESLLAAIPYPVFYMDKHARYLGCNVAFEEMYGISRESLIGKTIYERLKTPESKKFYDRDIELLRKSGTERYEVKSRDRSGNELDFIISKATYNDTFGRVAGLVCVIIDITEIKRLEAELKKSNEILTRHYSETLEKVQSYSEELQIKKGELLKLQHDNLQSQFETLKNQVNPHFLFNSLNVLASLISVDPDLAVNFTGQLSKTYRYVLEHRTDDLVELAVELEFMNSYVFLLNIRFTGKMKLNINLPDNKLKLKLPPLTLQLLVENAIKHNIFSTKNPLKIEIFSDNENYLNIINNFQKREKKSDSTGLGLKNIIDRYSYFTQKKLFFGIIEEHFVAKIPLLE